MFNNVIMSGRSTIKPELKYSQDGKPRATTVIAIDDPYKKGPDGKPETSFFTVKVFGKSAETLATYVDKGHMFGFVGRAKQEKWQTQAGENREKVIFYADRIELMHNGDRNGQSSAQRQQGNNGGWAQQQQQNRPPAQNQYNNDPFGGTSVDINEDDLPF